MEKSIQQLEQERPYLLENLKKLTKEEREIKLKILKDNILRINIPFFSFYYQSSISCSYSIDAVISVLIEYFLQEDFPKHSQKEGLIYNTPSYKNMQKIIELDASNFSKK